LGNKKETSVTTREDIDKLSVGNILYRFADGVSDSPACMGHFYCVTEAFDNGDLELWHLPEYLGDTYYTKNDKRRVTRQSLYPVRVRDEYNMVIYHIVETSFLASREGHRQYREDQDRLSNPKGEVKRYMEACDVIRKREGEYMKFIWSIGYCPECRERRPTEGCDTCKYGQYGYYKDVKEVML
jgi:hypothetical protein